MTQRCRLSTLAALVLLGLTACSPGSISPGRTPGDAGVPRTDAGRDGGVSQQQDAGTDNHVNLFAYVGTTGGNTRIHRFRLDESSGDLSELKTVDGGADPSFLAFSSDRRFLFAVNEADGTVRSYAIAAGTGELTFLSSATTGEGAARNGTTHLSLDQSGKWLLVANYGGGSTGVFPVGTDGKLGAQAHRVPSGANAHQIVTDPSNAFVFVPTLGLDRVQQYALDASTGALSPQIPPALETGRGSGPRHLAFHPSERRLYLATEYSNELLSLSHDSQGRLTLLDRLSTLADAAEASTGAEVAVHPAGHTVYVSNRRKEGGEIAWFREGAAGKLTRAGAVPTAGLTPRHFSLTPSGALLLVANQDTGNIAVMRVDALTGALTPLGEKATGLPGASFVGVISLPAP